MLFVSVLAISITRCCVIDLSFSIQANRLAAAVLDCVDLSVLHLHLLLLLLISFSPPFASPTSFCPLSFLLF